MKGHIKYNLNQVSRVTRFVSLMAVVLVAAILASAWCMEIRTPSDSDGEDAQTLLSATTRPVTDSVLLRPQGAQTGTPSEGAPSETLDGAQDETPADETTLNKPAKISIRADGATFSVVTFSGTVRTALREQGITVGPNDLVSGASLSEVPQSGMYIVVVRVDQERVEEVEYLDYEVRYKLDKTLPDGEYVVRTEGKRGSVKRVYTVVREDGVITSRTLVDTVRVEPVDEIIAYGATNSFSNSRGQQVNYSDKYSMVATAYVADGRWGFDTATGNRVRPGVIAVDPNVIPLNTRVYVKSEDPAFGDYGFAIAWDVGSAIKGNIIDLYMESVPLTYQWGRRNVTVYILEDQTIDVFALRRGNEIFISD